MKASPSLPLSLSSLAAAGPEVVDLEKVIAANTLRWKPDFRNPTLDAHNLETSVGPIKWGPVNRLEGQPLVLVEREYRNNSSTEQPDTFRVKQATRSTFEIAITAGLRVRTEVTGKLTLKGVVEIGATGEIEVSLSATGRYQHEFTQEWELESSLRIPARRRILAKAMLKTYAVSPRFEAPVTIRARKNNYNTGTNVYVYENVARGNWYRLALAGWVFLNAYPPRFSRVDDDAVMYRAEGSVEGVYGYRLFADVNEYDLDSGLLVRSWTREGDETVERPLAPPAGPATAEEAARITAA